MSPDEVQSAEEIDFAWNEEKDALVGEDEIMGLSTTVIFFFEANQLTAAGYSITEKHLNRNTYIDDYTRLENMLTQMYGEPDDFDMIWKDELYRAERKAWGKAICAGDLAYKTRWLTEDTEIEHELGGYDNEVYHTVLYKIMYGRKVESRNGK